MPAKSAKQRRLFGAALGFVRGDNPNASGAAKKIAETVSEGTIRDFARKKKR